MSKTKFIYTTGKVAVGKKINDIVKAGLSSTYTSTTTKSSGTTLTLKTLQKAFTAIKKADERMEREARKTVSKKGWRDLYTKLHKILSWLHQKERFSDYIVVNSCICAMDPRYPFPVHPKTKERCEELIKEFDKQTKM